MLQCELCGRDDFKNESGLRGHKQFAHRDVGSDDGTAIAAQAQDLQRSEELPDISELAARIAALEGAGSAGSGSIRMEQLEPALDRYLRERGYHAGICADDSCTPCQNARAAMAQHYRHEGVEALAGELESAAKWRGRAELADALAEMHQEWVDAGRPTEAAHQDNADLIEVGA